eukprot:5626029-Pyramimonas_sp.AAC.1
MCCGIVGYSRLLLEESLRWAALRNAFGKPLLTQVRTALPPQVVPKSPFARTRTYPFPTRHVSIMPG